MHRPVVPGRQHGACCCQEVPGAQVAGEGAGSDAVQSRPPGFIEDQCKGGVGDPA